MGNKMSETYRQHDAWNLKDYFLTMKTWIKKDNLGFSTWSTDLLKTDWKSRAIPIRRPSGHPSVKWVLLLRLSHNWSPCLSCPTACVHPVWTPCISKQVISRLCFWNKMWFSPTTVFTKAKGFHFKWLSSCWNESKSTAGRPVESVLQSICLGMVNICLAALIST